MHLSFDYQAVFRVLNQHSVQYLLICGLNYFLRHRPITTQDIDVLVESSRDNLTRCENALAELNAEWGRDDTDWTLTSLKPQGWMTGQSVFCMLTANAPLNIFLSVVGFVRNRTRTRGASSLIFRVARVARPESSKGVANHG